MARADAASPALGVPGPVLMANAGRAVARAVQRRFRPCRTLVLAGPGNNGGDGYVAARLLQQAGWPVALAALAPPRAGSDAADAASRWRGPSAPFTAMEAARAALVIDAVFGAGLARDVDGVVADALRAARRVVAVDVPSGLDGATGAVRGFAPHAMLTVTFFRLKPGHLLLPGRELCGEIVLADIGLPGEVLKQVPPSCFANLPELWRLPVPGSQSHKYSRGHVTVVGGATMTGAARLSADAARRGGAGLVTIAARGGGDIYRAGSPGLLVSDAPLAELLQDRRRNVWVCGPGLGPDAARATLPLLLSAHRCVVADADVFSAFAGEPDALRGAAVLTPHAGEFARAFGDAGCGPCAGRAGCRGAYRGGGSAEGCRYDRRRAGRQGRDQRLRAALARHRRIGRRAGWADRRTARPGHGAVGGRGRGRLPAWACRCNRGARSGGGGSASGNHRGPGRGNMSAISASASGYDWRPLRGVRA